MTPSQYYSLNRRNRIAKSLSALLILTAATGLSACSKSDDSASVEPAAEAPAAETTIVEEAIQEAPAEETSAESAPVTEPAVTEEAIAQDADGVAVEETAAAAGSDTELSADAGKALYERQCQACHATGLLEAPKFGNKEAWAPHIAKGKETLYEHSAQGFNKMPPQAVNGVSEAEVHAAVDYMIAEAS